MEKQKKGLFGTRNIYWIVSQPQNWTVGRRASDFKWLSERLNREFTQLSIPLFEGKSQREVEAFINSIVQNPQLARSQFLKYFLSCGNSKKFYERRKLEFSNSWIKGVKQRINMIIEDPGHLIEGKSLAIKNGHGSGNTPLRDPDSEDMRKHAFLEDLTNFVGVNRKIHKELAKELQELNFLMEQTNTKLMKVGCLFEKLHSNHLEIEKHPLPAIAQIEPPNSKLYQELKTTFFKMNNSLSQTREELKKIFEPRIGNMIHRGKLYVEVAPADQKLKVRKNLVKNVNSTTKDKSMIPDDNEKKMSMDERRALRQAKLIATNHLLFLDGKDILASEAEDARRMWLEFGRFSLQQLEAERSMWVCIMEKNKL